MFLFKKKEKTEKAVAETAQKSDAAAPSQENEEFKKNIKTLWIYTSLFCAFALILILISSVIQGKVDNRAENLQDQIESERTASQSTIQNIQTKNNDLVKQNEKLTKENEFWKEQAETEKQLLQTANEIIINAEYLTKALSATSSDVARSYIEKINPEYLSGDLLAEYTRLVTELDK